MLEYLIPLLTLSFGVIVDSVFNNLLWLFFLFGFVVITEPKASLGQQILAFVNIVGFLFGMVLLFELMGLPLAPFLLVVPAQVAIHYFLKGTKYQKHFVTLVSLIFILWPLYYFWMLV
jgi:hypothetical protein